MVSGFAGRSSAATSAHSTASAAIAGTGVSEIVVIGEAEGAISLHDLKHSEGNILFFGNFANLPESEFMEGMIELIHDKTVLYETMIGNIYGLGAVLKKKFALLRIAYTAFMIALILGVTSFIGVFIWIVERAQ